MEPAHGRPALIEGSDSSNAESMKLNFVSWTAKNLYATRNSVPHCPPTERSCSGLAIR